eukprot:Platyproteum_vivax@DN10616_c0_g1_i1.p1
MGGDEDAREGRKQSLLVRNLRPETAPEAIREYFSKHGEVRDVYVPLDYYTGRPRGFGFVEFRDYEDALKAMQALNKTNLDGNEIDVILAQERRKSPGTMRRLAQPQRGSRSERRRSYSRDYYDDRRRRYRESSRERYASANGGGGRGMGGPGSSGGRRHHRSEERVRYSPRRESRGRKSPSRGSYRYRSRSR